MIKVFIIPSAGSIGYEYNDWSKYADLKVQFIQLKYLGRGTRYKEGSYKGFEHCIEDIYNQIINELNDEDEYALLGHSMGTLILHKIYYKLLKNRKKRPIHLFMTGANTPINFTVDKLIKMSKKEFTEYFIKLGGMSQDILNNKDLLDYAIENILEDINLLSEYRFIKESKKIDIPVTIMNGIYDNLRDNKKDWDIFLQKDCEYISFKGGHFFILEDSVNVISTIVRCINNVLTLK
ncbi:MAG: thioesterase II family protein [Clostridium sp.]